MIKKLLFTLLGAATLSTSAQLNTAGTGLILDHSSAASNCNLNSTLPGNDGVMQWGDTYETTSNIDGNYLILNSVATIPSGGGATWYPVAIIDPADANVCTNLWNKALRIDMTSNTQVTITAKASVVGATFEFFVGSGGTQYGVGSSTYHEGAGIIAAHTFTTANAEETFTIDLAAITGAEATWTGWAGKNDIRAFGYRSQTGGAIFSIKRIEIGAESTGTIGGGGETCSDGIMNQDETGIDCGGVTCSPCGGGGGGTGTTNGKACIVTTDDGQAEATFYTNLEDTNHPAYTGLVTCSYNRADILGGMYGALETATLHGSNAFTTPAKYCGMCVEMTGLAGTATVQVVDECPDCKNHNSGDTDIDLSPAAFAAVVGDQSIGRSPITWKEISCPWATNIHLITQGSNDWYAKVIVGNHVNRIASVEISNDAGSTWNAMTRGTDNGWEKGGFGPDGVAKSFKITDIYGDAIIMSNINMLANPDAKIAGTEQFQPCGLTTSTNEVNPLDYVTVYPNPANASVTFAGITGATEIQIVNSIGRVVATHVLSGATDEISLNISGLASGLYIAKMSNGSNVYTSRFIKK
jgi:expansin (peptidoglycan-binding protein)